jgi:prepilin-type N-terminal cleavage/methylation domain-containing protein
MSARSAKSESGMTLIEVMVTVFIAALVFGAVASGMVNNGKSSLQNQRQTQLISVLQQRIEYVHQILTQSYSSVGFSAVALSSNPAQGSDPTLPSSPTDPNDFITPYVANFVTATSSPEGYLIEKNYNASAEGTIDGGSNYTEVLEVDPTNGRVAPVTWVDLTTGTTYSSASGIPAGDPFAIVYTYITRAKVGVNTLLSACPSTQGTGSTADDARRVIVAAKLYQPAARTDVDANAIQYATTLFGNPIPSNQCQGATGLRIGVNIL